MPCPFCDSANPRETTACRACGGPLRAAVTSAPRPPVKVTPVPIMSAPVTVPKSAPVLLARKMWDKTPPIVSVGFCADDKPTIALALENGTVQLWDAQADKCASFGGRSFGKPAPVCCAAFALGLAAMGHENGKVRLQTLETNGKRGAWKPRTLGSPAPHLGRVLALALAPNRLYSGGSDGVILATPLPDGHSKSRRGSRVLLDGLGAMTTLAVSPDGALLAVGGDDGAVRMWHLAKDDEAPPRLDWTSRRHTAPLRSLSFSPNGAMILGRSDGGGLGLWAAQTNYPLPLAPAAEQSRVAPVFAADNRWLALVNASNGVDVFDVGMETLLFQLPPLDEATRALAFSPGADATMLAVAGAREVTVWRIAP